MQTGVNRPINPNNQAKQYDIKLRQAWIRGNFNRLTSFSNSIQVLKGVNIRADYFGVNVEFQPDYLRGDFSHPRSESLGGERFRQPGRIRPRSR